MSNARIATHAVAALLGAGIALASVRTCRSSAPSAPALSAALEPRTVSAAPSAPTAPDASERSIPVIVKFNVPNPAVNVTQRENGTLEVVNSDPKLAGTQLAIEGITENGRTITFDVRVPAPRKSP